MTNSGLSAYRYSSYCLNPDRYREIAHSFIGMHQWVEYKPFYLTCCSEAYRDSSIDDKEMSKSGFNEAKEMEAVFGESSMIDSWMLLVRKVSWNFPGLETEESLDEHKQTVLKFMNKKQALCVRNRKTVVGVLLFSRSRNMICCLAVDPEHRKQGLASILLRKALDELDRSREITVSTFRENDEKGTAPRALYRKFGFQEGEMTEEFGYPNQVFVLYP